MHVRISFVVHVWKVWKNTELRNSQRDCLTHLSTPGNFNVKCTENVYICICVERYFKKVSYSSIHCEVVTNVKVSNLTEDTRSFPHTCTHKCLQCVFQSSIGCCGRHLYDYVLLPQQVLQPLSPFFHLSAQMRLNKDVSEYVSVGHVDSFFLFFSGVGCGRSVSHIDTWEENLSTLQRSVFLSILNLSCCLKNWRIWGCGGYFSGPMLWWKSWIGWHCIASVMHRCHYLFFVFIVLFFTAISL